MHLQPNSEHFRSFISCLRHSATSAADPAITPASDKIEGCSGEVTIRSNAAGFPRDQLVTRTSAGLVLHLSCPKPLTTSTWADTLAHLQHSTNTSQSLLWRETTSPPCLQVMAWWPKGSKARLGLKVQLRP